MIPSQTFARNECYYLQPVAPICTRNTTRQLPIDKDIVLIRLIQWNALDVIIPVSAAPSVKPGTLHTLPNRRVIHRIVIDSTQH